MNPIKYIIEKIDENNFDFLKKYVALFLTVLVIFWGLCYTGYYFYKKKIVSNISLLDKKKKEIEDLLLKKREILNKKEYLDALLANKESFRLKDFIYSALQKYNFLQNVSSTNENITQKKIKNDYIELQMTIDIENLSTSQMLEILAIIENDLRVYIKNLIIKNINNKLNVSITLATLQLISS